MQKIAVLGGVRIPFARSFGAYSGISNQELMTASLKGLVEKYHLQNHILGEVALGTVMAHSADWNFARECALGCGISAESPAYTITQACGTSLEAAILIRNKIALGQIDVGIAGGADTNSDLPVVFSRSFAHKLLKLSRAKNIVEKLQIISQLRPKDLLPVTPAVQEPRTGLSMGESCELTAKKWRITREEQDAIAYISHMNALKAYKDGFYDNLLVPFYGLNKDNNVRETTLEKMAKLSPVFDRSKSGTLTAANSSTLTDGSAAILLSSDTWAARMELPVLAHMTHCEVAAVDFVKDEGLLMAPTYAVSRMLKKANLNLQDFDFYEIHEAFAAQVLCTLKAWESEEFCRTKLGLNSALGSIDRKKMNVCGGSIALGHPFAATGARIVSALAKILHKKGSGRGLISICTGGGMGVTAILEKN
ncbi:MAG: acetyl-CoA acetyltransferase [Bdellovibrionales bacterium RBG_16_40_8]|nr:MAG: acetyl-CoA acetyltransferase [Bdellovibrionales bacterium RBG_16_40_8]